MPATVDTVDVGYDTFSVDIKFATYARFIPVVSDTA